MLLEHNTDRNNPYCSKIPCDNSLICRISFCYFSSRDEYISIHLLRERKYFLNRLQLNQAILPQNEPHSVRFTYIQECHILYFPELVIILTNNTINATIPTHNSTTLASREKEKRVGWMST